MERQSYSENELARRFVEATGGSTELPRIIAAACITWAKENDIEVSKIDIRVLGDWIQTYRAANQEMLSRSPKMVDIQNYSDL